MLDERKPPSELEQCGACKGSGKAPAGWNLPHCLRCRGNGKLTKAELTTANMCSKMLEDLHG